MTEQLGGRLDYGQPVLLLQPQLVTLLQERFDRRTVDTGSQLLIEETARQVVGCVHIGMVGVPTDHTTERLLVGTVRVGYIMTAMALL